MKLYTEEQAKYFFECGRNFQMNGEVTFNIAQDEVTPIELPSDEEIESNAVITYRGKDLNEQRANNNLIIAFEVGAEWMRDKIKGGNK